MAIECGTTINGHVYSLCLVNGHNGSVKPLSASLTKPILVSSAHESANGGSSLLTEKREPIVMRIPKLTYLTKKVRTDCLVFSTLLSSL